MQGLTHDVCLSLSATRLPHRTDQLGMQAPKGAAPQNRTRTLSSILFGRTDAATPSRPSVFGAAGGVEGAHDGPKGPLVRPPGNFRG